MSFAISNENYLHNNVRNFEDVLEVSMKISPVSQAICAALVTFVSTAQAAEEKKLEVIEVTGSYFNNYKVDDASGAMRTNASLLETPQSVKVIPDNIIGEQLATTLGEVLSNDASLSPGSKQ